MVVQLIQNLVWIFPNDSTFQMVVQLIQNLVWIFPNGSTANTKPCLDTKWWINGPSKTIWMVVQLASNTVQMVQNQWAFLKVEILNGFKWSISRRVIIVSQTVWPHTGLLIILTRRWCWMTLLCRICGCIPPSVQRWGSNSYYHNLINYYSLQGLQ